MNIFNIWYRWHPEVALRYLPMVSVIRSLGRDVSILDVGSGGLGVAPYLKRPVTGLDIRFDPPVHPLLTCVTGSALNIPFSHDSFDVVLSADTLEHMDIAQRKKAIREMIRVGKKLIMIAVPCGKKALEQDHELDQLYYKHHGKRFHFLEEQIGYGLPEEQEIKDAIFHACGKEKKRIKIIIKGNENLRLRAFLMKGWMKQGFLSNIFYRKILLPFLPMFRRMNAPPVYRKIFFITVLHHEDSN